MDILLTLNEIFSSSNDKENEDKSLLKLKRKYFILIFTIYFQLIIFFMLDIFLI